MVNAYIIKNSYCINTKDKKYHFNKNIKNVKIHLLNIDNIISLKMSYMRINKKIPNKLYDLKNLKNLNLALK